MNPLRLWRAWRRKRHDEWWARWQEIHRWDELATYNSECNRGIVHTPEHRARMAEEQRLFHVEQRARWEREGAIIISGGGGTVG